MPTPIRSIFCRRTFYRSERIRLGKAWREMIREAVLIFPNSPIGSLRSRVIQRARLQPLENISFQRAEPGNNAVIDLEYSLKPVYRNLAWLWFRGDGRLFKAMGNGHPLFLRPAVVQAGSAALIYYSEQNCPHETRQSAERDLPAIQAVAESQRCDVEAHNLWVEQAVDRALLRFAEHIKLWRLEGELDWARARQAA